MRLVNLETSDSEDESTESVIENTNSSLNQSICEYDQIQDLNQFEENNKVEKETQLDENAKIMFDRIGSQFYEFIGDHKDNQNDRELSKEVEQEKSKDINELSKLKSW